ncbi:MAG: hypothetical protein KDI09_14195, partial [Halioglobus sp.]|nr:hypothetical protein [Halioglobus sp.]
CVNIVEPCRVFCLNGAADWLAQTRGLKCSAIPARANTRYPDRKDHLSGIRPAGIALQAVPPRR